MVDQKHSYLTQKNGIYYYTRRVPRSLSSRFGKERFVKCLHTSSLAKAERISNELSSRLENIWDRLRLDLIDFDPAQSRVRRSKNIVVKSNPKLSEATKIYLRLKRANRGATFVTSTNRNMSYLLQCVGDLGLQDLDANHAIKFRDHLLSKNLSDASIKRIFASVKAVFNLGIREYGLDSENVFGKVYMPDRGATVERHPIPLACIKNIQEQCIAIDDEMRWLIGLLSDSGMRLSEACGLLSSDVNLDDKCPYVLVRPHPWRRLKTPVSKRAIPLVGMSLWAIKRAMQNSRSEFIFPRYCNREAVKANSASGGLNKWLKTMIPEKCVLHSFRHSFRDRLRDVGCPSEMLDALGGWSTEGIGARYGNGYSLEAKSQWMLKISLIS